MDFKPPLNTSDQPKVHNIGHCSHFKTFWSTMLLSGMQLKDSASYLRSVFFKTEFVLVCY